MTRLSEKLRLSLLLHKPTRFLSLKLSDLSASTLHLCKSLARALASKTLALFTMDDVFADDIDFWDLDRSSNFRSQRPRLLDNDDGDGDLLDPEADSEKVYLVVDGWWKEVQTPADFVEGVSYYVSSNNNDADSEILLNLRTNDDAQGFSGRDYALFTEATWVRALKRHNNLHAVKMDFGTLSGVEDFSQNVFPLQIKLFVSMETNSVVVNIAKKDNTIDSYNRACQIFISESEPLHIWDFSGMTTKIVMNESASFPNDSSGKPSREYLLQLQVHGFSDSNNDRDEWDDEMAEAHSKVGGTYADVKMNGSIDKMNSYSARPNSSQLGHRFRGVDSLGLIGLQNLGNTCFMNSAIQCLVHSPELVDFFLGDYCKELNHENPLGMKGDLALAFGELLRKLWAPGARPVAPRMFKLKIAKFASQFNGYNQHDSQEFLSFLLDGLHEDLNRVKRKPCTEAKDADGRPDEEVAEEHWENHLARNDSIIVDLFHGQYRSTLVCSICNKVSVTFDPFVYLSLPLPSTTMRTMTLTVLSTDGTMLPSTFTVTVPKSGSFKDLIDALSTACSLQDEETLMVAEIYRNRIVRVLEDPSDLDLIRDDDKLVAYRLPKESERCPLVVFMHQEEEKQSPHGKITFDRNLFGIPLAARLPDPCYGADICTQFLKLLNPFLISTEDIVDDSIDDPGNHANEDNEIEDVGSPTGLIGKLGSDSDSGDDTNLDVDFQFYKKDVVWYTLIEMNEPLFVSKSVKWLEVLVVWSDEMIEKYDTSMFNSLPAVLKPRSFMWRAQDSVSLYKCLEAYLKEEPLGPENMWYCPSCQKHQQASKKLDLWTLPDILVIHLKRFSYTRFLNTKLETYVDFPIDDLDLSAYVNRKNSQLSNQYSLYAISNHYGSTGGGHYTSFIRHDHGRWFEFDDDRVLPVIDERIKTSAAYVLFYRRVRNS